MTNRLALALLDLFEPIMPRLWLLILSPLALVPAFWSYL